MKVTKTPVQGRKVIHEERKPHKPFRGFTGAIVGVTLLYDDEQIGRSSEIKLAAGKSTLNTGTINEAISKEVARQVHVMRETRLALSMPVRAGKGEK